METNDGEAWTSPDWLRDTVCQNSAKDVRLILTRSVTWEDHRATLQFGVFGPGMATVVMVQVEKPEGNSLATFFWRLPEMSTTQDFVTIRPWFDVSCPFMSVHGERNKTSLFFLSPFALTFTVELFMLKNLLMMFQATIQQQRGAPKVL
ncbi:EGF-like domain-containing protein [Psidium guajava]|nr:EGF-like domain-containing protein [Psidium guajava]